MRVAIYTRVSTDHQAEEGFSLEVQHEKLLEYINRNKLQLFKFYTDPGVSAKDLNRPGLKSCYATLMTTCSILSWCINWTGSRGTSGICTAWWRKLTPKRRN
jgi:DNA invertase Pin-like site-specific DNA recombinase